jgi:hypothetical protein
MLNCTETQAHNRKINNVSVIIIRWTVYGQTEILKFVFNLRLLNISNITLFEYSETRGSVNG